MPKVDDVLHNDMLRQYNAYIVKGKWPVKEGPLTYEEWIYNAWEYISLPSKLVDYVEDDTSSEESGEIGEESAAMDEDEKSMSEDVSLHSPRSLSSDGDDHMEDSSSDEKEENESSHEVSLLATMVESLNTEQEFPDLFEKVQNIWENPATDSTVLCNLAKFAGNLRSDHAYILGSMIMNHPMSDESVMSCVALWTCNACKGDLLEAFLTHRKTDERAIENVFDYVVNLMEPESMEDLIHRVLINKDIPKTALLAIVGLTSLHLLHEERQHSILNAVESHPNGDNEVASAIVNYRQAVLIG